MTTVRKLIERRLSKGLTADNFVYNLRLIGHSLISLHHPFINKVDFNATFGEARWFGCGTVACHAGWIIQIFDPLNRTDDFASGFHLLDYKLGFAKSKCQLGSFFIEVMKELDAHTERDIWQHPHIDQMFYSTGYKSFGCKYERHCTLHVIGQQYLDVADRIAHHILDNK